MQTPPVTEANPQDGVPFWQRASILLAILAAAKGIRFPNPWAFTQFQIDYSEGFTRRGLAGAAFKPLFHLNLYHHFVAFSFLVLAILAALLIALIRHTPIVETFGGAALLVLFTSSYTVTYLCHLNGYFDILLICLTLLPLFLHKIVTRFVAAVVCTLLAMLTHEIFLFAFFPVLLFSFAASAAAAATARLRRIALTCGLLLAILGALMTFLIARPRSLSAPKVAALSAQAEAETDSSLSPEVFGVLNRSASENIAIMRTVWRRPTYLGAQVESLLLFLPCTLLLLYAIRELIRQRLSASVARWLLLAAVLATCSPLLLHIVGWDKSRWNSFLGLDAFLVLIILCRNLPGHPITLPATFFRLCLLCAMLNMATGGGMLDNRHIRPFPFIRSGDPVVQPASHSIPWAPAA